MGTFVLVTYHLLSSHSIFHLSLSAFFLKKKIFIQARLVLQVHHLSLILSAMLLLPFFPLLSIRLSCRNYRVRHSLLPFFSSSCFSFRPTTFFLCLPAKLLSGNGQSVVLGPITDRRVSAALFLMLPKIAYAIIYANILFVILSSIYDCVFVSFGGILVACVSYLQNLKLPR